jgi:hypothetical protein
VSLGQLRSIIEAAPSCVSPLPARFLHVLAAMCQIGCGAPDRRASFWRRATVQGTPADDPEQPVRGLTGAVAPQRLQSSDRRRPNGCWRPRPVVRDRPLRGNSPRLWTTSRARARRRGGATSNHPSCFGRFVTRAISIVASAELAATPLPASLFQCRCAVRRLAPQSRAC